jgi:hypothetical protein
MAFVKTDEIDSRIICQVSDLEEHPTLLQALGGDRPMQLPLCDDVAHP